MAEIDEVVKEFLVESYENLDQLDRDFVALEIDPTAAETLASIFRTIHTIKGTCGCLGFEKLESVAHVGENLLSRLRDGELTIDSEMTSGLLMLSDSIREILGLIESTGKEGDKEYSHVRRTLVQLNERGSHTEPVDAMVEHAKVQAEPAETHAAASVPPIAAVAAAMEEAATEEASTKPYDGPERRQSDSLAGNAIRVDVDLLDKLMNLVGELVLSRNQVLQFNASQKDATFLRTAQRLNLITTELQESVMKTRMQPIGNLWNKFPRIVRDVANLCGKKVRIEMEGRETELDKTIIEAIKDPLTHVIRNSVDHGIETPEARKQTAKNEEGVITMRAFHEGGQVNIEISDDGKGIDAAVIRRKAMEKGLISADQAQRMSDREAVNLIFLPGFSTAEKITNVSGRGVGMDVVKTNIEKIGGVVDIQSRVGQGTSLKIKIPLTLAIIPALIVTSGGERFAIPQVSLLELVRLEENEIEMINGTALYRLRGNLLPLVYLNSQMKFECAAPATSNIVVLRGGERQFGLVVDQINDTEEIVVKPLAKQVKGLGVFAGATIRGDGKVALILDVMGLAQEANLAMQAASEAVKAQLEKQQQSSGEKQMLLLFKLSGERRMAIPLSAVSRLEEFPRATIEDAGGQLMVQYRGKIMPLISVAEILGDRRTRARLHRIKKDRIATDMAQVVVYTQDGHTLGLLVEQILDVVEQEIDLQHTAAQTGVLGTAIIKDRVTELLDVPAVVDAAQQLAAAA